MILLSVGLALTFIGYGIERGQPAGFNRGKAVGLVLYGVGVILLFAASWWWGVIALVVPPLWLTRPTIA